MAPRVPGVPRGLTSKGGPGGDWPATVVLEQRGELDGDAVEEWIDNLLRAAAKRLLRLQGALRISGQERRQCCHGVHSFAMSDTERRAPPSDVADRSTVVVVGRGLDGAELAESFRCTLVDR